MSSSLIPEKPLTVSPALAATIGLEEAVMLTLLNEAALYRQRSTGAGREWLVLEQTLVEQLMPFWNAHDIQRVSRNLADKGVILLDSAPYGESRELRLVFNEQAENPAPSVAAPTPSPTRGASLIGPHWQPDRELMAQIAQHNIPEFFVREQLPEFITYWRERAEAHHAWGSKFLKHLLRQWREREQSTQRRDQQVPMSSGWRPSRDALEVLVKHANISLAFIEDAVPEFVLYWQERGDIGRTWNSKFIQHVKRQWLRYNAALEHDPSPRRIADDWQPSQDVYDVLRLANIDVDFARQAVPEFVLFWRDSNQLHSSWNTKFLQHVKYQWAKHKQRALQPHSSQQQAGQDAGQQTAHRSGHTRDRSLVQDLTDRSWAS
ncbi:DnaT-like ssDNA-binding domain-containing protein [Marinimicrobium alkaliphilum]|uniref:DnaT-like ssDNA-binding domain-containing protein n=1 Tax=Marinimicrobium alkaliphilum TaxID=2202654 RepID=UPI000DBA9236|nr:DnaT-like ssDNA-binding domain-containing protein [Marinimicrobium alkaliphilum]